jgi:hypothetical protein
MNAASASPPSPRQPRETRSIERISEIARRVIAAGSLSVGSRMDLRRSKKKVFSRLGRAAYSA